MTGSVRSMIFGGGLEPPRAAPKETGKKPVRPPNRLGKPPAREVRARAKDPVAHPEPAGRAQPDELRSPILILGDIAREVRLLDGDVNQLPRSAAEFENRLSLMLATVYRLETQIRQLIADHGRRGAA